MLSTTFLYFFNNLLSVHIHKCGEKIGGLASPLKPPMSAAYVSDRYRMAQHAAIF